MPVPQTLSISVCWITDSKSSWFLTSIQVGSQVLPNLSQFVFMMSSSWLSFPVLWLGYGWAVDERHDLEAIAWRRLELVRVLSSHVSSLFLQLLGLARRTSTCLGKLVCGWSLCPETRLEPWLHITYVNFAANCSDYSSMKHTTEYQGISSLGPMLFYGAIPFQPLLTELYMWACRCRPRHRYMTKWISSFWEMFPVNPTFCKPTCLLMELGDASNASIYGLTQQQISTCTLFCGISGKSCKLLACVTLQPELFRSM